MAVRTTTPGPANTGASRSYILERSVSDVGEDIIEYDDRPVRIWLFSAIVWLTFVDLVGLTIATELITPNIFGGIPYVEFGRIRPIHVDGVIFAWLSTWYWGAIFYMLPRLLGLPSMKYPRLAYWMAWAWNIMFAANAVALSLGYTTGREYEEPIWPIFLVLLAIWMVNQYNVVVTVLNRRVRPLYVTVWWILAAPLWLAADEFIVHVMWIPGSMLGNGVPGGALTSALPNPVADAMLNWWGNHNLFGLWLTPMLVAVLYYMVPRLTNTPLYSHTLSLISFWGIAFFYTGVGNHHLLQAPTPGWLKTFATVNSVMLLVPVVAFVTNQWLTMRGNWDKFITNLPLRFALTGLIFYFLVNVQGSIMATPQFNQMIHFTNFVVAHAHLALLGSFTILGMGFIDYVIPQIYKKPLYSRALAEWQYWLVLIGFLIFFWSLTFASFLQGQSWAQGVPEVNVLPMIRPHYIARAVGGSMILTSGVVQLVNIYLTVRRDTSQVTREEIRPYLESGYREVGAD